MPRWGTPKAMVHCRFETAPQNPPKKPFTHRTSPSFRPHPCPRHYRPDSDQYHGCSTTIILLYGKYSSLHTRHNLLSPRVHSRAPTRHRIPAQGKTLGLGIQNRTRSEGTPHSIFIPVPQRGAAYQPRVKPWDSAYKIGRVLKERHIASSSQCPTRATRHHRPDSDQSQGCSTTIILL